MMAGTAIPSNASSCPKGTGNKMDRPSLINNGKVFRRQDGDE